MKSVNDKNLRTNEMTVPTKSVGEIFRTNLLTLFHGLNLALALAILFFGDLKNALFMGVVVCNAAVGIIQELRAKKMIDKLSVISEPKAEAYRQGKWQSISGVYLRLDDLMLLSRGQQVLADAVITEGECQVDESLITGENDPVMKHVGEELYSGSFIVSGKCQAKVIHVGMDNYAAKISARAKYLKKPDSEIMRSVNRIIKTVAIAIVPIGIALFCKQYFISGGELSRSVTSTVAALVGMIPEGLVLLTSVVLAVGIVRLGRKGALIQELYSIEMLARVDTLCLDKTGTLTEGSMKVEKVLECDEANGISKIVRGEFDTGEDSCEGNGSLDKALHSNPGTLQLAAMICKALEEGNATAMAIIEAEADLADIGAEADGAYSKAKTAMACSKAETYGACSEENISPPNVSPSGAGKAAPFNIEKKIPFSSERKWSAVKITGGPYYIMGAPEFVFASAPELLDKVKKEAGKYTREGLRVIAVAADASEYATAATASEHETAAEHMAATATAPPGKPRLIGLLILSDIIRENVQETIEYFTSQGVNIKIISGDDPETVSMIAKRCGVPEAEKWVDTSGELTLNIDGYTVFGRVTPDKKLEIIKTLKSEGHTVAMMGDGVNDVMALKESDCSIAPAAGSDAARNVSQIVLTNSDFAALPQVVAEGRRSINNLQRSASLFLTKTIFASLTALIFIFISAGYPLEPIHLTLVSALTIGAPSFVLALQKNTERVKGNFLMNVLAKAVPGALTDVLAVVLASTILNGKYEPAFASAVCAMLVALVGFMVLFKVCLPFDRLRAFLFIAMLAAYIGAWLTLPEFLSLAAPGLALLKVYLPFALIVAGFFAAFSFGWSFLEKKLMPCNV